ncbi:hypothetical protein ACFPU1_14735 [Thalassorhabdus alkalitolerans]|uniref:Gas vesicle protein n=1 Tax=Thalassorhabdus alkalitolerans TaxID=2282697 RepID=A0ABW0YNE8_9BACI
MSKEQKGKSGSKLVTAITVGALAGAAAVLIDSNTRSKVKGSTTQMKDSVAKVASDVKEDPAGTKDQMMDRVQEATNVLKEAVDGLQSLYDKANDELFDKVSEVKEDTQEVISSAKEAGEDLQEVGSKVKEAKDELTGSDNQSAAENNGAVNNITDRPV